MSDQPETTASARRTCVRFAGGGGGLGAPSHYGTNPRALNCFAPGPKVRTLHTLSTARDKIESEG
jgi:hypothetical protein